MDINDATIFLISIPALAIWTLGWGMVFGMPFRRSRRRIPLGIVLVLSSLALVVFSVLLVSAPPSITHPSAEPSGQIVAIEIRADHDGHFEFRVTDVGVILIRRTAQPGLSFPVYGSTMGDVVSRINGIPGLYARLDNALSSFPAVDVFAQADGRVDSVWTPILANISDLDRGSFHVGAYPGIENSLWP